MKKRIIGTVLTAAMLASAMPTAFAGFYPTGDFFEATDVEQTDSRMTFQFNKAWKWDQSDNLQYKDTGIAYGNDAWFSGFTANWKEDFTHYDQLFKSGWPENDNSILLTAGMDDTIVDAETLKNSKYAHVLRNGADMCEWNGYLFVLMNQYLMEVQTPEYKYVATSDMYYYNEGTVFAANEGGGVWAKTDINGNYILDDNGDKITVEGFVSKGWLTKNSSQIQVYDITNGGKTMIADWDCQEDLGINGSAEYADYCTVGLDVTDDYIYCYVAPRGYTTNYAQDGKQNLSVAIFENTIDRENAYYEVPTRVHLNGEVNNVNLLCAGNVNISGSAYQGFRHFFIGDKLLTIPNNNMTYNRVDGISIANIGDIANRNISYTQYKWNEWLNFDLPSDCTNANAVNFREFSVCGNKGYAWIQYPLSGDQEKKFCQTIIKYDLTDPKNPVELARKEYRTVNRKITILMDTHEDYMYTILSYDEGLSDYTQNDPMIIVFDVKNDTALEEKQVIHPTDGRGNSDGILFSATTIAEVGNWLYVNIMGGRGNNAACEYFFKLTEDKTEIEDAYATVSRIGTPVLNYVIYGNRMYVAPRDLWGANCIPQWMSKVYVYDMSAALPVDLKLDSVPEIVEAPYTLTGKLAGAAYDGDVFMITVNNQEPTYVNYTDIEGWGFNEGDYWASLKYTITDPGDYTITVTPMDSMNEAVEGAAETVSFTVAPASTPEEFKLSAAYSSSTIAEGKLTVTPKITNNIKQGEIKGIPVAALYKDNKLVDVKTGTEQTIAEGAYLQSLGTLELTVPTDTDYSKYNVKVFLFDSLKTFKPLLENVSLKK